MKSCMKFKFPQNNKLYDNNFTTDVNGNINLDNILKGA